MAWFIDQWVEKCQGFEFSHIENSRFGFVSETTLNKHSKRARHGRAIRLPGKRKERETAYFFKNAYALGLLAKQLSKEEGDDVIAVLFRDTDGAASAGRGLRIKKVESIETGFESAGFNHGVAMMPNPKSEAWLLCALKSTSPYQHCTSLEDMSGNDNSPNSLKMLLEKALGKRPSADELSEMVKNRQVNICRIDMPSLQDFKSALARAVKAR
ncbi:hypothetical protein [Desulfurispira natronophila]|uniref:Uncharacterized protein n=1 Tax=Desulfurispira natronophila TaxID=682562 RepID=A0A7W8DGY5_9BACT|nr:hypothetical protein [Desulfurispira natronophila]MBB5021827.1 hypothetical protein [Desulfurispira natronophila]